MKIKAALGGRGHISLLSLLIIILFFSSSIHATENEEELFNEASSIIATTNSKDISLFNAVKSVSFSGKIDSFQLYSNKLFSYTQADLFLDVRLPKEIKAFADVSFLTTPQTSSSNTSGVYADIKELFVDYNIDRNAYIRTGKQFIKWGRGYFWNPVDFINQSRPNFLNLEAVRSGVTGVRFHVPRSNQENAYVFIDTSRAENLKDIAAVAKYEGLIGNSEWGASIWAQSERASKFGLEFSSHFLDIDWVGETAMQTTIKTPSVLIGASKQFNWERPNRITLHYETFYSGLGYSANVTKNVYHAAFISISEFPFYPTTFNCNLIQNLTDGSGILTTGLNYTIVEGLSLNNAVIFYFGSKESEFKKNNDSVALLIQGILTF
jgi:hypothetical protein